MKNLTSCLALALTFCPCLTEAALASPLEVRADPPSAVSRKTANFTVSCRISNSSSHRQSVKCYSCSVWQNWSTDQRNVFVPVCPCRANILNEYTLEPGQSFRRKVVLQLAPHLAPGRYGFHLSFFPVGMERTPASGELSVEVVK